MKRREAIELAIESVVRDGFSDITSEKLEISIIETYRDEFRTDVEAKLKKSTIYEMEFRPVQYILTPKNRYVFDYRKAAIIHPSCLVKYLSLVLQFADQVEAARLPVSRGIVFSNRFNPNGESLFDRTINYSLWRETTAKLATEDDCQFIVSCDIAGFYDRINLHRIESTLLSIGVDSKLVSHVNELLLFWSKKDSYGLPVGNDASRILSEVALIDIDEYLISEKVKFTRYVDDYRLFAPDILVAQEWMNKLTTRLFRDGLMLNISKTKIRKAIPESDNKQPEVEAEDHNTGDGAEAVLKTITKLAGGYSRITRRFIMPATDKHDSFKAVELEDELSVLESQPMIEFSGIQKMVIAAIVQKKFAVLIRIAQICSKYLYSLDYFIDMLIKNAEFIPRPQREEIADFYARLITRPEFLSFEWHCASIIKLLSHDQYFRKRALIELYRVSGKEISTYPSMLALEGLQGRLTRSEFRTIREYFDRSDEWEKRRLAKLSEALPGEERKAWAKSIKSTVTNDKLCHLYVDSIIKQKAT